MPKSQLRRTAKSAGTGWPAVRPTCSPGCPAPRSVPEHRSCVMEPSPRPAAGGRSTCSGSRRGSAAPLTSVLRRWRWSVAGRRRRGRGGAPGLRAALGRPREAERPRLGRSCAPRAPATAPRWRPKSARVGSIFGNLRSIDSLLWPIQVGSWSEVAQTTIQWRRNGRRFVHTTAQPYHPPFRPFRYHPEAAYSLLKPVETAGGC